MSFLSGIMKSIINPATLMQLAMGPAGWASLAARTIGTAIAQQVIQQLGQSLGLSPAVIGAAQMAFSAASGQPSAPVRSIGQAVAELAGQYGLSAMQQGQLERAAQNDAKDMYEMLSQAAAQGKQRAERGSAKGGKGSWLRELATAMSAALDSKINEMKSLAAQLDKTKTTSQQNDLQVATQEFSFLMNATANMIKTVGEGLATMARKG
jgi:hypothetical protein